MASCMNFDQAGDGTTRRERDDGPGREAGGYGQGSRLAFRILWRRCCWHLAGQSPVRRSGSAEGPSSQSCLGCRRVDRRYWAANGHTRGRPLKKLESDALMPGDRERHVGSFPRRSLRKPYKLRSGRGGDRLVGDAALCSACPWRADGNLSCVVPDASRMTGWSVGRGPAARGVRPYIEEAGDGGAQPSTGHGKEVGRDRKDRGVGDSERSFRGGRRMDIGRGREANGQEWVEVVVEAARAHVEKDVIR